jgi:hypothetical protein
MKIKSSLIALTVLSAVAFGPAANAALIISEIDSDTPGTDIAEFVEIYSTTGTTTSLDGFSIVFFNGGAANDASYLAFDLDGFSTDASGYFLIGNSGVPGVGITVASNTIQNGADAVALYAADATSFPNGTVPTTLNLVDALVYDTSDPDDTALLTALGETIQYDENGSFDGANDSISFLNGSWFTGTNPTPGTLNVPEPAAALLSAFGVIGLLRRRRTN